MSETEARLVDYARRELSYLVEQWDDPVRLVDELTDALEKAVAERDASRQVNAEFLAARAESPTTVEWGVRRDEDTAQHSRAAAERTIAIQRKRKMKTVLIERNVGPWEVVQS